VTGGQTMKSIMTKHSIASAGIQRAMLQWSAVQLYGLLSVHTNRQTGSTVNVTTHAIKIKSNANAISQ